MPIILSAEKAAQVIQSKQHVFIHSAAATPQQLVKAMTARASELNDVHIYSIHTEGDCSYALPQYASNFHIHSFFNGANIRKTRQHITSCFVPIFLSQISNSLTPKVNFP